MSGAGHEAATRASPQAVPAAGSVAFVRRERCVACGSERARPVWGGRFSDVEVRSHLARCGYAGAAVDRLAQDEFVLVECTDCGMRFHRAVLAPASMRALYSEWIDAAQIEAAEARRNRFEDARQAVKHVLRLRAMLPGTAAAAPRLLDYGCGDGGFVALARLFGWQAFGVDVSATRQQRASAAGSSIVASLDALDHVERFQAITLFQVLEHVPDPGNLIANLATRLDDGGVLVVEVPDCQGVDVPRSFEQFLLVHPLEHINAFTPKTLEALCSGYGFARVPRRPAHVTVALGDLLKSEVSRFYQPATTNQYFVLRARSRGPKPDQGTASTDTR